VGFQAKWDQPRTGDGRVDLSLDLAEAAIEAAPLALKKPAGAPGTGAARLVVRAGEVVAIEDVAIQTPAAALHGNLTLAPGASVRTADLVTTLPRKTSSEPVRLTIAVRPEGGATRLTMSCDLASFWLEATQARSDWTGGRLDLDGRLKLDPGALRFDGHLDVRDVALKRSPVLAGILNLTSLSGVKNALTGKGGLRFDRVVSDLVWDGDQLQIRDGAATGPTIRILMDGTIDTAAESANLAGTLIPSYYGLNEAAPSIPVIGQIFGGSAKAAWTVEFKVTGPLADPKVSVNPLTSIAPGILRDVLKRLGG
jgi:hypothetical protein